MLIEIKDYKIVSDNKRLIPIIINKKPRSVTSAEYKKCKKELIEMIQEQLPEIFKMSMDDIRITIKVYTYKDIGNILKVILDALEGAEVIRNDRYVTKVDIQKIPIKRGQPDTVYITL